MLMVPHDEYETTIIFLNAPGKLFQKNLQNVGFDCDITAEKD